MRPQGIWRIIVALLALWDEALTLAPKGSEDKVVLCYYGSWSKYRWGNGTFDVEDIDPFLCTHLTYAFVGLDPATFRIIPLDPYNDLEENWGLGAFKRFTGLKAINPSLTTFLAVGGWNEGSTKYSEMASTMENRKIFTQSAVEILLEHGFDGLDLDWEYPGGRSDSPGSEDDKENFGLLLREMRTEFDKHNLKLTAAVSAGRNTIEKAYPVDIMSETLDLISVMTYDFHGWWEGHSYAGHHSPLYARDDEQDPGSPGFLLNSDSAMNAWVELGARREQLLMGMGSYGRGFILTDANAALDPFPPANGPIMAGRYTQTPGVWGFNEYCEKMLVEADLWEIHRDSKVVGPVAVQGNNWFGFDDEESIRIKSQYVLEKAFGGAMMWSIDTDDFLGLCSGGKKFAIAATIAETLGHNVTWRPPGWEPSSTAAPPRPGGTSSTSSENNPDPEDLEEDSDEDECPSNSGLLPDPDDCSSFFVCAPDISGHYSTVASSCPPGLYFNPQGYCDWPENVKCPSTELRRASPKKPSKGRVTSHSHRLPHSSSQGHRFETTGSKLSMLVMAWYLIKA